MRSPSEPLPHERFETWLRLGASRRWRWQTGEAACLVALGVAALLLAPAASSLATGAILIGAGSATLLSAWRAEPSAAFGLSLLLALVALATGLHLLGDPPETALALIFAACLALRGLMTVQLAAVHRRQRLNQWEWFAVSGAASLIMAGVILAGLPGPYVWMLGLLMGVALIFDGSALLAVILSSDRLSETAPAPILAETHRPALRAEPACEDSIHV